MFIGDAQHREVGFTGYDFLSSTTDYLNIKDSTDDAFERADLRADAESQ